MRLVGSLPLAILLSLTACGEKKIDACNSDKVKYTLMNATFLKMKSTRLEDYQKQFERPLSDYAPSLSCFPMNPPNVIQACKENQAKEQKERFNATREYASKMIDLLNKTDASIVNVRQQDYDKSNNIRFCAAEFDYKNLTTEIGGIHPPACGKSIAYKIEPLQDKPDSFYVSWECL